MVCNDSSSPPSNSTSRTKVEATRKMEDTLSNAFGFQDAVPAPVDSHVSIARNGAVIAPLPGSQLPVIAKVPERLPERLAMARERLRYAAEHGVRIRVYEVALDLDMSEFHFARQFRAAYGCSPHVYYDEVRAARARDLLKEGESQGSVARKIGLRRPAELRALLNKRQKLVSMTDIAAFEASL
jgi:AraC-like DNA-binding protein